MKTAAKSLPISWNGMTQMSSESKLIYSAILKCMEEVGAITKDKKTASGAIYNYRGVDQVMNALQPVFINNGVFVVPTVLSATREERVSKNGVAMIYSVGQIKYTFYATDGSFVEAVVLGEGMDTSDKASNKVMANAFKYACFQVLCIPTEETAPDNEQDNHEITQTKASIPHQKKQSTVSKQDIDALRERLTAIKYNMELFNITYGVEKLEDLTPEQFTEAKLEVNQIIRKLKAEKERAESENVSE